jgi:hypothetical protein
MHAFQIISPFRSFKVVAATRDEKIDWMLVLIKTITDWKAKTATYGISQSEEFAPAPVWVTDKEATNCVVCNEAFGVTRRRVQFSLYGTHVDSASLQALW